ncbi:hypothetical protein [Streptomyces californicus]|uniref:hypothetical protein n=1 Tax=Streptomyces californicus TaxID=67351 RepID=UPI003798BE2A
MSTTIITEHPAWHRTGEGDVLRVVERDGVPWVARWTDNSLQLRPVGRGDTASPGVAYASPIRLTTDNEAAPLADALARLGTVARLTNPSLWDAITTALLRQVVQAGQARKVYRTYCEAYGRSVETPIGSMSLAPTPETVLGLSDDGFKAVGASFNRTALRAAATAYLERGEEWRKATPDELVQALIEVPRIGPWTAAAATADYTGDHSLYPHGDLAVRTWAKRAAPSVTFPSSDREFEQLWRRWAPDRLALHTLTLFTLTWGNHAGVTGGTEAVRA